MNELSIGKMEMVRGCKMSLGRKFGIAAVGVGAIGVGAITGGVGFYAIVATADLGLAPVAFMNACGSADFQ